MKDDHIIEKRMTTRLVRYWERLCQDSNIPDIGRFNSGAIQDIWRHCIRLAIVNHGHEAGKKVYKYEYVGEAIKQAFGQDPTGITSTVSLHADPGGEILLNLQECADAKKPVLKFGQFINKKNEIIKYRSCMLPFGSSNMVTHIIVGLSWRISH